MEGTLTEPLRELTKPLHLKPLLLMPESLPVVLWKQSTQPITTVMIMESKALLDTLSALDDAGIVHFGYDETAVMDVKGIKVGLVGIYELNDHLEREQQLKDNIAKVKSEGAQLTL